MRRRGGLFLPRYADRLCSGRGAPTTPPASRCRGVIGSGRVRRRGAVAAVVAGLTCLVTAVAPAAQAATAGPVTLIA
jgi:hypothetical protein